MLKEKEKMTDQKERTSGDARQTVAERNACTAIRAQECAVICEDALNKFATTS